MIVVGIMSPAIMYIMKLDTFLVLLCPKYSLYFFFLGFF